MGGRRAGVAQHWAAGRAACPCILTGPLRAPAALQEASEVLTNTLNTPLRPQAVAGQQTCPAATGGARAVVDAPGHGVAPWQACYVCFQRITLHLMSAIQQCRLLAACRACVRLPAKGRVRAALVKSACINPGNSSRGLHFAALEGQKCSVCASSRV